MKTYHPIGSEEINVLNKLLEDFSEVPKVLEVGVGASTEFFLSKTVELYCIDIDEERLNHYAKDKATRIIKGLSYKQAPLFEDNFFDLIFIDGCHRYNVVNKDLEVFYPKIKKGGYFCGHDFEKREYDERFIHRDFVKDEDVQTGRHHGVIKAVVDRFPNVEHGSNMWWIRKCE